MTQEEISHTFDTPQNREQFPLLFCLKHIFDFYFGDISYDTILNLAPKSDKGFTDELLIDVANEVGLHAVKKEMKVSQIPNHFLPCVITNSENKSLVLIKKSTKEIVVFDPIKNEQYETSYANLKSFKEAILIFRDNKSIDDVDLEQKKDWFWSPIKGFWRSYVEIGILTLFINMFALAVPLFTMSVYDRVVPNNAYETLFVLAGGVVIILLFDIYFKSVRNYIIENIGKKLGIFFEEELMKRMLHVQSQYDSMLVGSKANLFRELHQVRDFFATKSIVQVIDLPFFFIAVLVIFLISPMVALVPVSVAVIILIFNVLMQIPISRLSKENVLHTQQKHSYLVETLQGSEVIKLSTATSTKLFNWRNLVALTDTIAQKIQSLNAFSVNLSQTVVQLVTMLVIVVGVFEIAAKNLSIGGLIAVTILASRAMVPVIHTSMMVIRFKEIKDSLEVINDFWHLPLESDKKVEIGIGKLEGNIEFKDVSFYYPNSKYPSIHKCSFKINPGEKVGIIGQTGSGKTTILRLLTALADPTKGSVFIDGHDISTIHPVELRQNIGVMTQEPFLFSGSLKENIELSHPISKEKMMELIKITGLDELVKKTGQGDGLQVGEGGMNLSLGQRHLVALARSILADPPILVLDEPTTGLDVGLENTLVKHMNQILENKTLLVITHRFAALELVDRVIVLNNGKIVADGPKKQVLEALQKKRV